MGFTAVAFVGGGGGAGAAGVVAIGRGGGGGAGAAGVVPFVFPCAVVSLAAL